MNPIPQSPVERCLSALSTYPRTLDELAAATEMSRRSVEEAIRLLRLDGYPVVTDENGAKLSRDPTEVRACADALRRRYVNQAVTARALRRTAHRLEDVGQVALPWSA